MTSITLPREINYAEQLPSIPECLSYQQVLNPISGTEFGSVNNNYQAIFDYPQKGFMNGNTLYFRYKMDVVQGAVAGYMRGTPVYTPILRLDTLINSMTKESINNFGAISNMWLNNQLSVSDKYGLAVSYGYGAAQDTFGEMDGRPIPAGATASWFMAAPLPCMFSLAEKLIPLEFMPQCRTILNFDVLSNMFSVTPANGTVTAAPGSWSIKNLELVYDVIDFNSEIKDMIRNMGEKIYIKTSSFMNTGYSLGISLGQIEIPFNIRLSSIKSLFATFSGATRCVNGVYDSVDITSGNGYLQYSIAGQNYPSREINTATNKAALIMELKKAVAGSMHTNVYNTSINATEFGYIDANTTTIEEPGKLYFGINTEKFSTASGLLTGISSNASPISLRLNLGTATTQSYTIYLTALYDALLEIDTVNRQCDVKI